MERKQVRKAGNAGKQERARPSPKTARTPAPRMGEGAASALASLKSLERDRADAKPTDDDDEGPLP